MISYLATYTTKKKSAIIEQILFRVCFIISAVSVFFLTIENITGGKMEVFTQLNANSSELALSFIQCILGMISLYVPIIIEKITGIKLPNTLKWFFYIFVLFATVLGEVCSLYYIIPWWDNLLHISSGIMLGMFGGILLIDFFKRKKCENLISPMFFAAIIVCFAVCIGVVWEIYEFAGDSLLGLNMQKFILQDGTALIGQVALIDTMTDLILDSIGSIVAAISAYSSLKHKRGWLYSYLNPNLIKLNRKLAIEKETLPHSA